MIEVEMIQGIDERGNTITHVSKDYPLRKYGYMPPYGMVIKPQARFKVKFKTRRLWFERSESFISHWLYKHLEIYNVNYELDRKNV